MHAEPPEADSIFVNIDPYIKNGSYKPYFRGWIYLSAIVRVLCCYIVTQKEVPIDYIDGCSNFKRMLATTRQSKAVKQSP